LPEGTSEPRLARPDSQEPYLYAPRSYRNFVLKNRDGGGPSTGPTGPTGTQGQTREAEVVKNLL